MTRTPSSPIDAVSRRSALAAVGAACSLPLSGCINRARSVVDPDLDDRLSLSIVTVPADDDRVPIQIARHLESNLEAVGIDVSVAIRSRSAFLEAVLLEHEFDLYVGWQPAGFDPDFLYGMLHSTHANEAGWQNPFGFTNMTFDRLLEAQRAADGKDRVEHVDSVLQSLVREKPFEPICFPDEYRLARTDRVEGWRDDHLGTRLDYLGLESVTEFPTPSPDDQNETNESGGDERASTNDETVTELHALITDSRPTQNLNPLSATVRERATSLELLYDSLGTVVDGRVHPWIAESWEWESDDGDPTATITLREDCQFHDGEPVTADDVAFTYRFFADTALDQASAPSPAPRYCSAVSVVDDERPLDDHHIELSFSAGQAASRRALTVPILPAHIWRDRVDERVERADEFTPEQGQWSVVTTDNVPPVGSGPYQFAERSERDSLTLERFDDHFTRRADVDYPGPSIERLRFGVDPGSASAVQRIVDGDADVTASMLEPETIEALPASDDSSAADSTTNGDHLQRLDASSSTFYHVGFNTRKAPLSNVHFRRALTRLLDKEWLVESVFHGHARPTASPVGDEWVPTALEWDNGDPATPFLGTDGELDVDAARTAFEAAGFRYKDGRLLR